MISPSGRFMKHSRFVSQLHGKLRSTQWATSDLLQEITVHFELLCRSLVRVEYSNSLTEFISNNLNRRSEIGVIGNDNGSVINVFVTVIEQM